MLTFDQGHRRFSHRVAGACIHDGYVLLTRAEGEDFWFLPGGRVEFHEDTRTALRRELAEELGCEAEIGRLLWVVEGFFTLSDRHYHEIAFVYEARPSNQSVLRKTWTHKTTDGGISINFRWFYLDDLEAINLQPAFLKEALPNPPSSTAHLIRRE